MQFLMADFTSPDLVEAGQHPYHERGWHRDGVPGLLQHHLVPPHYNLDLCKEQNVYLYKVCPTSAWSLSNSGSSDVGDQSLTS